MSMTREKPYLHWDRRLDLRAVARRVLSEGAAACEGARLRQRAPDLDRGQRHVLSHAEARRPSASGRARCRTASCSPSRVRATSPTAACWRKPAKSIERFLDSGVTELGDKLGPLLWQFAPVQEIRRGRFRRLSRAAARERSTAASSATSSRCGTTVSRRRSSSRCCANSRSPVVYTDHDTYPNIADITGDFVYARLQKGEDDDPDRLSAEGARCLGQAARSTWAAGKEPADLPRVDRQAQAEGRAARRVCLCHPRGQGARAGRGDGADRAVEGVEPVPKGPNRPSSSPSATRRPSPTR